MIDIHIYNIYEEYYTKYIHKKVFLDNDYICQYFLFFFFFKQAELQIYNNQVDSSVCVKGLVHHEIRKNIFIKKN